MAAIKPCVVYKETLDVSAMEQVKLETVVAGAVRSKKVPVFMATHGVEGLLHVIDKFNKTATRVAFQPGDLWDQFEEVLDTVSANKWNNQVQGIANNARTRNQFNTKLANFVHQHTGAVDPRDILIKHVKGDECHKPRKVDVQQHASRMETLCCIANRLIGNEPDFTEAQIKNIIFESFPASWQNDYKKSHRDFDNDTVTNIVG